MKKILSLKAKSLLFFLEMPKYMSPAQRKRKREKEAAKKKHAAEEREKRKTDQPVDQEAKKQQARERREKTKAFNTVSQQNLELSSEVYKDGRASIWIGKKSNAKDQAHLQEIGITHVLNCAGELPIPDFYTDDNINFLHIAMKDRSDFPIQEYFIQGSDWLAANLTGTSKILVHCQEGRSRSASMVVAYLIRDKGMTYNSALATITARRHLIQPNTGFQTKLIEWEAEYHPEEQGEN